MACVLVRGPIDPCFRDTEEDSESVFICSERDAECLLKRKPDWRLFWHSGHKDEIVWLDEKVSILGLSPKFPSARKLSLSVKQGDDLIVARCDIESDNLPGQPDYFDFVFISPAKHPFPGWDELKSRYASEWRHKSIMVLPETCEWFLGCVPGKDRVETVKLDVK